ncbi:hypothetical protein CAOG_008562 [Capsaspora owczarzaki ATCC 30864]|uniref:Uncharacterized protein n=1 Tax=Capsaspora owczarzaki (strain ATCC 30864) TaxID=595528 RepID=A0A0D2X1E8_CAPO3|nr:hypothetical protein CAOG_008562 [Capsaspora owczarzaki ATCC 30864]
MSNAIKTQVLAPVADILSQLVMADGVDDKIPVDMVDQVPAIMTASRIFQEVALAMRFRPEDEDLKASTTAAMKHVDEGIENIKQATRDNSRSKLIGGVFIILESTRSALGIYDELEIRRIVATGKLATQTAATMLTCQIMLELEIAAKMCAEAHLSFVRMATSHAPEILDAEVREQLLAALEIIKTCSTLTISAARTNCEHPSTDARHAADSVAGRLAAAVKSAIDAIQTNPGINTKFKQAGELWLLMDDIGSRLMAMLRAVHDTDKTGLIANTKKYAEEAMMLLKRADEIALACQDPYLAAKLKKDADLLRMVIPEVVKTLQDVAKGTVPEIALEYKVQEAMQVVASVMQSIGDALDSEIARGIDHIHALTAKLNQAVADGDLALFEATAKELEEATRAVVEKARLKAEQCSDPVKRQKLLDAAKAVETMSGHAISSGRAALAHPTPTSKAHFAAAVANFQSTLDTLENAVNESVPLGDLLASLQQQTQQLASMPRLSAWPTCCAPRQSTTLVTRPTAHSCSVLPTNSKRKWRP